MKVENKTLKWKQETIYMLQKKQRKKQSAHTEWHGILHLNTLWNCVTNALWRLWGKLKNYIPSFFLWNCFLFGDSMHRIWALQYFLVKLCMGVLQFSKRNFLFWWQSMLFCISNCSSHTIIHVFIIEMHFCDSFSLKFNHIRFISKEIQQQLVYRCMIWEFKWMSIERFVIVSTNSNAKLILDVRPFYRFQNVKNEWNAKFANEMHYKSTIASFHAVEETQVQFETEMNAKRCCHL